MGFLDGRLRRGAPASPAGGSCCCRCCCCCPCSGGAAGGRRGGLLLLLASWLPDVPLALALAAGLLLMLPGGGPSSPAPPRCRGPPDPPRNASEEGEEGEWGGEPPCPTPGSAANATGAEEEAEEEPPCRPARGAPPPPPPVVGAAAGLRSTPVTQWALVCNNSWKAPLEQTTYLLGWLVGYVAFGSACDRIGRRATFILALMLSVPLGLAVTLAVSYVMFVLTHLLFGAVLAGAFISLYVARLELCDPPHRLGVTMMAGFFWVAGELMLPGLAVACKEWRLLQGAITLGFALLAAGWWSPSLFPESARWLLATGQLEEGQRLLGGSTEGTGAHSEEDSSAQAHRFAEHDDLFGRGPQPQYHNLCHLFGTRVVWKNAFILGFTAFIGSGIRHCFTRNLPPYGPRFYFPYFLLAVSKAVAILFLCLTVDRFGRRAVLLSSTILTGVSSLLLLALTQHLVAWLVLTLSVLGLLASHAVAALSVLFASELLPTVVRGSGLGLILAARAVGWAATPLMDIHNRRGFFLHHMVFASFAILSVLSILLLPESTDKPLPDTLDDGEKRCRPPLFHAKRTRGHRHRDYVPLFAPGPRTGPYDPDSYARLVTATHKMLDARHDGSSLQPGKEPPLGPSKATEPQGDM